MTEGTAPGNPGGLARVVRRRCVEMAAASSASHVGSSLSVADILASLYTSVLRHDPSRPDWPDRDRVIMSKGHASAALYATLAETGYFPTSRLADYYMDGSDMSGHVSHSGIPGVEISTGSLGHGLSIGAGMALASTRRQLGFRTFVVMSDGECDEGSVWEAAMFAGHHALARLVAVIDYNKMQSLTSTTDTLDLEPFASKWSAFGWEVIEVDGHDCEALAGAMDVDGGGGRPTCVIAHTIKGKGVGFMEGSVLWHYRHPAGDELAAALAALDDGNRTAS